MRCRRVNEILARTGRGQVRERHQHRQSEASGSLPERRDRGEKPRREVKETPRAPLAPVHVEQNAEQHAPQHGLQRRLERADGTPRHAPERIGRRPGPMRNARRQRRAALLVARQPAIAATRAAAKLVPMGAEPVRARPPEELEVARKEIQNLRDRADEHRAEDQVPAAEAELPRADGDLVVTNLDVFGRPEPDEHQAHARGHGADERHVRHGLVGEEKPVGHRRQHERPEQRCATAERLRDALVEEIHRQDREQDHRRAHRPFRVHHRLRPVADQHLVGLVVHAERRHGDRLHPHVEDGLAPEPAVLRPPEADPVVTREHLARDLAVVGLPGIPERVGPHEREVEGGGGDHDPEAVPFPERALDTLLVGLPGAELAAQFEEGRHVRDERDGDEHSPRGLG